MTGFGHNADCLWVTSQNGLDTINFRAMKDSRSLDLEGQIKGTAGRAHDRDDGEDPFIEFSSLTRWHDGDL